MPVHKDPKKFTGRMTMLHDTTENWNALRGFIPYAGEIIIYDDWKRKEVDGKTVYIQGVKIGTGNAYVQDLAFCNDIDTEDIIQRITNLGVLPSSADKLRWDNKLSVRDTQEVIDETLIFRRE